VDERSRVDHYPAADDVAAAGMENARGNGLEHELLAPHHHGVAGIVAALVAHDHVEMRRDHVHHFALALVAPLGAHDNAVRLDALLLLRPGSGARDRPGSRPPSLAARRPGRPAGSPV